MVVVRVRGGERVVVIVGITVGIMVTVGVVFFDKKLKTENGILL